MENNLAQCPAHSLGLENVSRFHTTHIIALCIRKAQRGTEKYHRRIRAGKGIYRKGEPDSTCCFKEFNELLVYLDFEVK